MLASFGFLLQRRKVDPYSVRRSTMELKYRPALRQCCERSAAATVAALVAGR